MSITYLPLEILLIEVKLNLKLNNIDYFLIYLIVENGSYLFRFVYRVYVLSATS